MVKLFAFILLFRFIREIVGLFKFIYETCKRKKYKKCYIQAKGNANGWLPPTAPIDDLKDWFFKETGKKL